MNSRQVLNVSAVLLVVLGFVGAGLQLDGSATDPAAEVGFALEVETDPIPTDAIHLDPETAPAGLQESIDAAPEGAVIVVEGGEWSPLTITKPLRLIGLDWPLIDLRGEGTGILIESSDVIVEGFDIRNTGRSFDKEDSGIYFEGQRNQILNNRMTEVLFGINGAMGHDSVIAGNYVQGQSGVTEGLRGDGIKVWYSQRVRIHNNHVQKSRDLLVWYSNECDVYENLVMDSRYGFHFMNSDDGNASRNAMVDNSVGIYIMYGKRFTIQDNLLQNSRGPSGHGLGLKEVDGFKVVGNVIFDNRIGIFNDNSPFSMNATGVFHHNMIAYNDTGIGVMPSARANTYYENSFVENLEQVTVLGGGELSEGNVWSQNSQGNYWSDYTGYDSDGDGRGDVAYRNAAMSEQLRRSHPQLQLFRFSLAETAVDFAAEAVPLFQQNPVLEDPYPLVKPVIPENAPEVQQDISTIRTGATSIALILVVVAGMWWANSPARVSARSEEAT